MMLIRYPSLQQRFAHLLIDAVAISSHCSRTPVGNAEREVSQPSVPIQLDLRSPLGTFTSPIALQLAMKSRSSMEIATDLVALVPPSADLKLWVKPPGWIYGQFSEDAIASILQKLIEQSPQLQAPVSVDLDKSLSDRQLFLVQYAHARCCALLRLGQREALIDFEAHLQKPAYTLTTSIPWTTEQGTLQLQHPAARSLLQNLLAFPNRLGPSTQTGCPEGMVPLLWPVPKKIVLRDSQAWAASFLQFYRDCRILGEVSQSTPKLSQARLGLVSATQRVLAFLLQDLLHVVAPVEL
ncbi:MAG: DALR anticodon-binding domain-containing protein [Thermosynechococcaceae cyanobacterium]